MTVAVLGIRHHGPGSARSLVAALDSLAARLRAHRGAVRGGRARSRSLRTRACARPSRCSSMTPERTAARGRSTRSRCSVPEWQAIAGRSRRGRPGPLHRPRRTGSCSRSGVSRSAPRADRRPTRTGRPTTTRPPAPRRWPADPRRPHRGAGDGRRRSRRRALVGPARRIAARPRATSSRRCARRWPRSATRDAGRGPGDGPARSGHAPRDPGCGGGRRDERIAVVCGAWHVPRSRLTDRRPPTTALLQALPRPLKDGCRLGSVDLRAACGGIGLRRGHRVARLVRAPLVGAASRSPSRGWPGSPRCSARRASTSRRRISSRRRAWRKPSRRCAAAPIPSLDELNEAVRTRA